MSTVGKDINSSRQSRRSSVPLKSMNTKSTIGMKEDNTIDSAVLKNSLHDFYTNSKEKLTHFKTEIGLLDEENEKLKEENIKLSLKSIQLQNLNEQLGLRMKGTKEKLNSATKSKNDLQFQIREIKRDTESTQRKVETMKMDTNYKVKMIENDISHINNVKENNVRSIQKKIEYELNHQKDIKDKIKEIKAEIDKYKTLITDMDEQDADRVRSLHKETAEMTRFLSEI